MTILCCRELHYREGVCGVWRALHCCQEVHLFQVQVLLLLLGQLHQLPRQPWQVSQWRANKCARSSQQARIIAVKLKFIKRKKRRKKIKLYIFFNHKSEPHTDKKKPKLNRLKYKSRGALLRKTVLNAQSLTLPLAVSTPSTPRTRTWGVTARARTLRARSPRVKSLLPTILFTIWTIPTTSNKRKNSKLKHLPLVEKKTPCLPQNPWKRCFKV